MWTVGTNVYGQLGRDSYGLRGGGRNPAKVSLKLKFVRISAGDYHSAAVDKRGRVFCWGLNRDCQCGSNFGCERITEPTQVGGELEHRFIVDVSCGGHHTMALTQNGEVYMWGRLLGQRMTEPTQILPFGTFEHIAAGWAHCACIDEDGKVYTFGGGAFGRLGMGSRDDILPINARPCTTLINLKVKKVALGMTFTVVLTQEGVVFTFGENKHGQLGRESVGSLHLRPGKVEGLDDVSIVSVAAGTEHAAAISDKGRCFTWGRGERGTLGHGHTDDCHKPTLVDALKKLAIVDIACGTSHTVFITDTGTVYACGNSWVFFVGVGNVQCTFIPQCVAGPTAIRHVACGAEHTVLLEGSTISHLGQDLLKALNNMGSFADVLFHTNNDKSIFAHKCILRQSPFFNSLLDDTKKECFLTRHSTSFQEIDTHDFSLPKSGVHLYVDFSSETLLSILQMLYSGFVSEYEIKSQVKEVTPLYLEYSLKHKHNLNYNYANNNFEGVVASPTQRRKNEAVVDWMYEFLLGRSPRCATIGKVNGKGQRKGMEGNDKGKEIEEDGEKDGEEKNEDLEKGKDKTTMQVENKKKAAKLEPLAAGMWRLLKSGVDADVVFHCEDEQIPAHKAILSSRCTYFATMFKAGMRESSSDRIVLNSEGMSKSLFIHLLTYIYTNVLPLDLCPDEVLELLELSERYSLPHLKFLCESGLMSVLDIHSGLYVLEYARVYRALSLEANCIDFLVRNWSEIERDGDLYQSINPQLKKEIEDFIRRKKSYVSGN
jgi:alpha-tubulin suppressor-like RCC1 family protein